MDQADSVHSTPPTNAPVAPARRRFLSQAAGVAAGSAVLALGTVPPRPANASPAGALAHANANPVGTDPIFAAIDAHKAARVVVHSAVAVVSAREKHLTAEGRRWGGDDRQLKECEAAVDRAFDAETDAACVLLGDGPTTIAGVLALLQYANAADDDGEGWPAELLSNDGDKTRSWHYFLIESLAEVLPGMVPPVAS